MLYGLFTKESAQKRKYTRITGGSHGGLKCFTWAQFVFVLKQVVTTEDNKPYAFMRVHALYFHKHLW